MHLVQLLLPLTMSDDARKARFEAVLDELTSRFGGVTAFVNSPARGLWESGGERQHDRIITVEVMVEDLDASWWSTYRHELEEAFEQEEVVVRSIEIRRL